MRASAPTSCRLRTNCQSWFRQRRGNRPRYFSMSKLNLRRGAVFDDFLAVQFHFSSTTCADLTPRTVSASSAAGLCRLCKTLFRCSNDINNFVTFAPFSGSPLFPVSLYRCSASLGTVLPDHAKDEEMILKRAKAVHNQPSKGELPKDRQVQGTSRSANPLRTLQHF